MCKRICFLASRDIHFQHLYQYFIGFIYLYSVGFLPWDLGWVRDLCFLLRVAGVYVCVCARVLTVGKGDCWATVGAQSMLEKKSIWEFRTSEILPRFPLPGYPLEKTAHVSKVLWLLDGNHFSGHCSLSLPVTLNGNSRLLFCMGWGVTQDKCKKCTFPTENNKGWKYQWGAG